MTHGRVAPRNEDLPQSRHGFSIEPSGRGIMDEDKVILPGPDAH